MSEANSFGCEKCMKNVGDKQQKIKNGARKWKQRAKATEQRLKETEKRCVELLKERNIWQDEHTRDLSELAQMLAESDKKLAGAQVDLQNAIDAKAEVEYELLMVKAHAYDLAFGNREE